MDDVWDLDDDDGDTGRQELERESKTRQERFFNSGFRDGIDEGKNKRAQEGFDKGYKEGALAGSEWGKVRGALVTLKAFKSHFSTDEEAGRKIDAMLKKIEFPEKEAALSIYNCMVEDAKTGIPTPGDTSLTGDDKDAVGPMPIPLPNADRNMMALIKELKEDLTELGYPLD